MKAASVDQPVGARWRDRWRVAGRLLRALPWLLLALVLIGLVLVYPIVRAVAFSFTDRDGFSEGQWIGIANYAELFGNPLFLRAFLNNLILLISVPAVILVALVLVGLLLRGLRGTHAYEFLLFLPFLPAVASISVIYIYILGSQGPLNAALRGAGLDSLAHPWLTRESTAIWSILAVIIWKRIGFTVLLLTARATTLDRTVLEAAAIDGASWWRTYWQVIVPQLTGVIQFAAILGFLEVFSFSFAYVFMLTRGGPDQSTFTLEFLTYDLQFDQQLIGLASAVAVTLLCVSLLASGYRAWTARREMRLSS